MIFLNLFFSFFVALEAILLLDAAIICKNKILSLKFCLLFYLLFFGTVFCANFFLPVYLIFGILQTVLLAAFCILAVCRWMTGITPFLRATSTSAVELKREKWLLKRPQKKRLFSPFKAGAANSPIPSAFAGQLRKKSSV